MSQIHQDLTAIDFTEEMKRLQSPRRPHDMITVGDSVLRAVLCEGEGKWYVHDHDEFFLHYMGDVVIESDRSVIELRPGSGVLVPAGLRHRTNCQEQAIFLVFRHQETACVLA